MFNSNISLIDQLNCWLSNKYEEFTRWYWNKSPHHVKCRICGEKMSSDIDRYSPEEGGWKCYKDGSGWVCHRCDLHRDFAPYVFLTDIDESIAWENGHRMRMLKAMKRLELQKMLQEVTNEL